MKASNICPCGFAGPLASGWVRGCRYMRIMLQWTLEFQIWIHAISQATQRALGISKACVWVSLCACASVLVGGARRWGTGRQEVEGKRQSHRPRKLVLLKMLHLLLYSMTMSKL